MCCGFRLLAVTGCELPLCSPPGGRTRPRGSTLGHRWAAVCRRWSKLCPNLSNWTGGRSPRDPGRDRRCRDRRAGSGRGPNGKGFPRRGKPLSLLRSGPPCAVQPVSRSSGTCEEMKYLYSFPMRCLKSGHVGHSGTSAPVPPCRDKAGHAGTRHCVPVIAPSKPEHPGQRLPAWFPVLPGSD